MKESFDMYHKAWESYYGMSKDRPKSSREKPPHPGDRRSRTPENRDKFPAPPPAGGAHGPPPGMPGPFPGMMPGSKCAINNKLHVHRLCKLCCFWLD